MVSKLRERTEALLPGKDIQAKRGRVSALMASIAPYERATKAAQRDTIDAVYRAAAGHDIDVMEFARREVDTQRDAQAAGNVRSVALNLNQQLAGDSTTIAEADTLPALAFLREELARITSNVTELDLILGNITDASTAIREGHAESWSKLEDLVAEYDEVRRLQGEIYSSVQGVEAHEILPTMCRAGLIADALHRDGNVLTTRMQRARNSPNRYPNEDAWRRWLLSTPADGGLPPRAHPNEWWPDGDRVDYLRRLATTATPWLPNLDTLGDTAEALGFATHETLGNGITATFEQARARYAELTGTSIDA